MPRNLNVRFLNTNGNGLAEDCTVVEGTTIQDFFHQKMGRDVSHAKYAIRVERHGQKYGGAQNPITASFQLQEGDVVVVVPEKVTMADSLRAELWRAYLGLPKLLRNVA